MPMQEVFDDHNLPAGGETLHLEAFGLPDSPTVTAQLYAEDRKYLVTESMLATEEDEFTLTSHGITICYERSTLSIKHIIIRSTQLVQDEGSVLYIVKGDDDTLYISAQTQSDGELQHVPSGIVIGHEQYDIVPLVENADVSLHDSLTTHSLTVCLETRATADTIHRPVLLVFDEQYEDHIVIPLYPSDQLRELSAVLTYPSFTTMHPIDIADTLQMATLQTIFSESDDDAPPVVM